MNVIFENSAYFKLMWVVLGLAVLTVVGLVLRRRALRRFADTPLLKQMAPSLSGGRRIVKATLFVSAMALLVVTLADVRWGKRWTELPQKGVDVMFVLDVSKSMFADDVSPSRLTRATEYVRDMMNEMGGDRAGLVAFAGNAKQVVPLTNNYSDVSMALDELGPHTVTRGGSRLGDAIQTAADCFVDKTPDHKAIVIIADGEDQDSQPVEAAKKALAKKGIRIYTVGLGNMQQGSRIPVQYTREGKLYLKHDGKEVWTKMDGKILKATALAGGGAYIPAGTKQVDMADVYHQHIARITKREFQKAKVNAYIPRFQWFLAPALLLLLLDSLIGEHKRVKRPKVKKAAKVRIIEEYVTHPARPAVKMNSDSPAQSTAKSQVNVKAFGLIALAVLLSSAGIAQAEATPREKVQQANRALQAGKIDEAIKAYDQAQPDPQDIPQLRYNQGIAHYRKGEFKQAEELLRQSLASSDQALEARARFNLGNCQYAQALPLVDKKKRDEAIGHLKKAINHYRDALAINKNDSDARANVELAQLLIKQLKQEKKQQQKQDKKNQKQNKQNNKNQKNQQQKQDQKKQDNKQNQNKNQDKQSSKDQQKQNKADSKDQKQSQNKNQDKKKNSDPKADQQRKKDQQQAKQDKPKQQDKKQAGQKDKQDQKQSKADQQKQQAQQQQGKDGKNTNARPNGATGSKAAKIKGKLTPEEAARLLQAVRDKNLKRRKQKYREARAVEVPVDRDW